MNKQLKDRVIFIRAMMNSVEILSSQGSFIKSERNILEDLIKQIRQNKNDHFVSISQERPSQVSYARIPEHKYNTEKRIRCPLGRYIMRNLDFDKTQIRESVLTKFVQNVWANIESENIQVDILTGQDIVKAYRSFDETSSHSCMTGSCCKFVALYALNPDKVSMLVYDEIRALLWKTDEGVMVFDRCYPSGHGKIETFRRWAKDQGYVLRSNPDKLCDDSVIKLTDNKIYTVTLQHKDVFPYLDTFCYGNIRGKEVVLSNSQDDTGCVFQDQYGGHSLRESCFCDICDSRMSESDTFEFEGTCYCESCYSEYVDICINCAEPQLVDNTVTSNAGDVYCVDCYEELYLACEHCLCEVDKDDVTYDKAEKGYCARCVNRHLVKCFICREFCLLFESVNINGDSCCEECADEHAEECNGCDDYVLTKEAIEIDDDLYCEDCTKGKIKRCNDCGGLFWLKSMTETQEGFHYCDICSYKLIECDSCGDFVLNKNLVFEIKNYKEILFSCCNCAMQDF